MCHHLLAATALATVLGMAMGLSELELLIDLSQPDLRLRAPDLVSPPGGPGAAEDLGLCLRCFRIFRDLNLH